MKRKLCTLILRSEVSHLGGDFIVAKHIPGHPEYWQLPEKIRNTKEIAKMYDPRIVNGSIMATTYDIVRTQEEIITKYSNRYEKKRLK